MSSFATLEPEYLDLLSKAKITRTEEAARCAERLVALKKRYADVSEKTGVPIVWLMAINERESGTSFATYLGNGDPLHERTRHVPAGRGPFSTWEAGAIDALHYDHISDVSNWDWARALYESELWNGFGPRMHRRHSSYLWAGTSIPCRGKYISDGIWSPWADDSQLGVVAIMVTCVAQDKSLSLPGWPEASSVACIFYPLSAPSGFDGGKYGVAWLQTSLNALLGSKLGAPLLVDGSFGRMTRMAVCLFQQTCNLAVDGVAGPKTLAKIETVLAAIAAAGVPATVTVATPKENPMTTTSVPAVQVSANSTAGLNVSNSHIVTTIITSVTGALFGAGSPIAILLSGQSWWHYATAALTFLAGFGSAVAPVVSLLSQNAGAIVNTVAVAAGAVAQGVDSSKQPAATASTASTA